MTGLFILLWLRHFIEFIFCCVVNAGQSCSEFYYLLKKINHSHESCFHHISKTFAVILRERDVEAVTKATYYNSAAVVTVVTIVKMVGNSLINKVS